ncbi:growth hormone secretagogue receptor type 1-like [Hemicordylus capensis]|uniref:growth hormone secretagogue receptor type 1-like n=1 Tax=Hemicordylus capensis TaxID=884348 RepID=UPI0023024772|nr:growth hormone secretagogue receptor type 1-like [Hemicordylus capensis]
MLGNGSTNSSCPNFTVYRQAFAGEVCKLLFMILLVVAITLGNAVSLLVFFRIKQFRTSQGYLKVSLAVADMAVGLVVVPYSVYREANFLTYGTGRESEASERLACSIIGPIFAGCTLVSISTIFLLSVERTIAVLKPLHKEALVTKRRTVQLIFASWAVSFCLATIPLLSTPKITQQYNSCSRLCNYAFPADELPGPYWHVMLVFPVFDFTLLSSTFVINLVTFAAIHQNNKTWKSLAGELQVSNRLPCTDTTAAKTISILTFAFFAAFSPIAVFVVGSVMGYLWCEFSFYAFWILTSNSCWNVAIYSIWDPKFRQGLRELFNKAVLK